MEDIRTWFNGKRNYNDGVKLYLLHGNDPMLTRLFTAEGYSDFKMVKLTSALDELLANGKKQLPTQTAVTRFEKQVKVAKTIIATAEKITESFNEIETPVEKRWPEKRDEILQSLWLQWRQAYGEMMNLTARLYDVAKAGQKDPNKEQEAGRMALKILDLDEECDKLYYNRDYYIKNKKLPLEIQPIEISLDPALWGGNLENHKRYVRKFKRDLAKDPSNTTKAELLQKHEWAVAEYKRLLKRTD